MTHSDIIHNMSPTDIAHTAFLGHTFTPNKKKPPSTKLDSIVGVIYPHRNPDEVCPYCKSSDTEVVRDVVSLKPFSDFYGDRVQSYVVMYCFGCPAVWSFYIPK